VLKVGIPEFDSLAESGQRILKVGIHSMGVDSGGQGGAVGPHGFSVGTVKVEGGIMVLFFDLVFPVGTLEIFLPTSLMSSFSA